MRHLRLLSVLCILAAPLAAESSVGTDTWGSAARPAVSVWSKAFEYGEATAHAPNYDDKKLWPHLTGKEYFLKTAWPKTRVLTWASPGRGGNPTDPKNWIDKDTGQPASSPPDIDTDIILPAAESYYMVDFQNGTGKKGGVNLMARCVTVGKNANLYAGDAKTRGNVWVRRGGYFMTDVTHTFSGSDHTFYRNENDRTANSGPGGDGTYLCQYLKFDKATKAASAEFFGHLHTFDEFQVVSGTMIVSADSVVEMGREAFPYIEKNAAIVLLDNAYLAKWINDLHCYDMEVRGGTLQAGLPDRPLTRSARFLIGPKNFTNSKAPAGKDAERQNGITLYPGATLRTISADVKKARLIIGALPKEYPVVFRRSAIGSKAYAAEKANPANKALLDWLDSLPSGIDMQVAATAVIDGVELDGFRKGGLMLENGASAAGWKNVIYGPNNLAKPAELIGAVVDD